MPHIIPFMTPAGPDLVGAASKTVDMFLQDVRERILIVFHELCGEVMDLDNVPLHPIISTTSMPVSIQLVIVAWDNPERRRHQEEIEQRLRDEIFPGFPENAWQLNLILSGTQPGKQRDGSRP